MQYWRGRGRAPGAYGVHPVQLRVHFQVRLAISDRQALYYCGAFVAQTDDSCTAARWQNCCSHFVLSWCRSWGVLERGGGGGPAPRVNAHCRLTEQMKPPKH